MLLLSNFCIKIITVLKAFSCHLPPATAAAEKLDPVSSSLAHISRPKVVRLFSHLPMLRNSHIKILLLVIVMFCVIFGIQKILLGTWRVRLAQKHLSSFILEILLYCFSDCCLPLLSFRNSIETKNWNPRILTVI